MKEETYTHSFAKILAGRLKAAGLQDAELVSSTPESPSFGDAESIFRLGPLFLHFVRDRGEEFVDVASSAAPQKFFQLDDLDIAMGWKTIDEVLSKQEPESLDAVLARIAQHGAELHDAFSGVRERLTRARVERAAQDRGQAFMGRLRGKFE